MASRGETELRGLMEMYPKAGLTLADAGSNITAKINLAYGTNYATPGLAPSIAGYGSGATAPGVQAPGSGPAQASFRGNEEPTYAFNNKTGVYQTGLRTLTGDDLVRQNLFNSTGQNVSPEQLAALRKTFGVPSSVPSNTAQITQTPAVTATQSGSPYSGSISSASASNSGVMAAIQTQMASYEAEKKAVQEQQNTILGKLSRLGSTSTAEVRNQQYSALGVDPAKYFADQNGRVAEISALTEQYNALVAQRDQAKAAAYDRLGSTSFINNTIAQIDRNAAPQLSVLSANINSKAATMQALQGNFSEASKFVDQAVQDVTADKKMQVDLLTTFLQLNETAIGRLETKYQNAFNLQIQQANREYDNAREDAQTIGNLLLEYPNAGIQLTDSLAVAQQKAAKYAGTHQEQWSAPYMLGGDYVQKNTKTGEIRTAVNVPVAGGGKNEDESVVSLYSNNIRDLIVNRGQSPETAVFAASGIAKATGQPLSKKQQNELLEEARRIEAEFKQNKPAPAASVQKTQPTSAYQTVGGALRSAGSFVNSLFSR